MMKKEKRTGNQVLGFTYLDNLWHLLEEKKMSSSATYVNVEIHRTT